ncbi:ABC transporter related [Acidimicrobium ferrooxidans DSM 10331]|uniref:ABC transporter related n=1 Tax=Acidimicrobium ferrooxidans (strain DSM 10331 / JCM 15462 / NBRC 103882 / ICP) TaxID=525909 RepID=C7M378_ACIFD|nr:ABC transporter ATP-binding protein [Acidimicrobium ferrooxidans]ACU53472.1 ABC transporter related [Acidimicrobium ferrooxidans DSM 10331]
MSTTDPILVVDGVVRAFGGVHAVDGCSFTVADGSITGLIGPNGAGKSTMVNLIAGALRPDAGTINFDGHDITGLAPHKVAELGLIRTFQISREYPAMTVMENLMVSPLRQVGEGLMTALFAPRRYRQQELELVARARGILAAFGLEHMRDEYAGSLSGGQKRLLELARAVMAEPKMLILDEPMAGINPALVDRICEHINEIRSSLGVTFLIVEHNLDVVERITDHVVVMAAGCALATGTMAELRENEAVVNAYLTGGASDARAAR